MKIDRLLGIVMCLINRDIVSATKLAEQFSLPEDEKHWFGKILSYGNKIKVIEPASLQ